MTTTSMTDTAAEAAVLAAATELRLPSLKRDVVGMAAAAEREGMTYLGFLNELLTNEVDSRRERRQQRRIKQAKFPRLKRLEDFDMSAAPSVNPATIATLAEGAYLAKGDPVVLLGDSGTGKSHLLIGLGLAACAQGKMVRYVTAAALANELAEAADERQLSRLVARYGRLDLLCLDEVGYVRLDARGAEFVFQILTEREERASIALASNLPFSEWGQVFEDPRLVAAIVDRVTFNAHIIETGSKSYRLASSSRKQ